ncbi:MAG: hypothetical protein LC777_15480 [Actinobacteria bacterium]|nr:hypothetical protein [Actinomycetota bacterium]
MTGAERRKGKRNPVRIFATPKQHRLDKQLAAQAELAYRRLVKDWQPAINKGRGCRTAARISSAVKRPSSAAGDSPTPCALARGHPHPTRTLAKEPPIVQRLDFHP